jgi:hypothetical protein
MNSKLNCSVYNKQSDFNKTEVVTHQNSIQMNEEEKSDKNIKQNKKRSRTPLKLHSNFKESKILNLMKNFYNNDESLGYAGLNIKKPNDLLKETNERRLVKREIWSPIGFHLNFTKNGRKNRSNSEGSIARRTFISFQNILPITVKIINLPKNLKLKKIRKRIDARIDKQTFLCLKYNKTFGVLYIKFRNEIYYNFYSYLFNGRTYYKNGKYLKMIEIQENENLWTPNADEEILMLHFDNAKPKDNFYISYIEKNFRFFSKSKFYNYFYNQ